MAIDPKAIAKARSRIRIAEKALGDLEQATSHAEFSDTWYVFLTAAKNVYTSLEQGSKASAEDRQWFGGKKNERKSDPLLQYLFQSRDDDEHGLEEVTELEHGSLQIGGGGDDFSQNMMIGSVKIGSDGKISVSGVETLDGNPVLVEIKQPHTRLATVTGRGPVHYPPPNRHMGQALSDNLPATVGRAGLNYLKALLSEAEGRA